MKPPTVTQLVPLPEPASRTQPNARAPWVIAAVVGVAGLCILQFNPKLHPTALADWRPGADRVLRQLSRYDPTAAVHTPKGTDPGDPLGDYALFSDWLADEARPAALTVGGAIDAERPRIQRRFALEAAATQRALAEQSRLDAMAEAAAERLRAEDWRRIQERAAATAQAKIVEAAQAKTVACNTARAHAYGTASSVAAFITWVRAHPCPEGTDIGDGYWNVAH